MDLVLALADRYPTNLIATNTSEESIEERRTGAMCYENAMNAMDYDKNTLAPLHETSA